MKFSVTWKQEMSGKGSLFRLAHNMILVMTNQKTTGRGDKIKIYWARSWTIIGNKNIPELSGDQLQVAIRSRWEIIVRKLFSILGYWILAKQIKVKIKKYLPLQKDLNTERFPYCSLNGFFDLFVCWFWIGYPKENIHWSNES